MTRKQIEEMLGCSEKTVLNILKTLVDKGIIESVGSSKTGTCLLLTGSNNLPPILPYFARCQLKHTFHKFPKSLVKQGIPGQIKENENNDKNTFHLPWQYLSQHNV